MVAALSRAPFRFTLLALCCAASFSTLAATEDQVGETVNGQEAGSIVLDNVTVDATAVDRNALPPAYAGGQVARGGQLGVLGNQDIMDVPFNVTSYTEQLIRDQQAESVGDVLLNDSSVRQYAGFANQAQAFVIRGYKLEGDDISYNGLYGVLPRQIISTDALERVEVFKGPNAFINGVTPTGSGIGGGVNLQPKRAQDTPTRSFTADISDDGRIGQHLDVGQRFGDENRFGVRLNLSQREGDTAVDDENQRTKLFVAGLDYRGDNFRLSGDFGYQKQRVNGGRNSVQLNLASVTHIPDAPSADTNYAAKWSYTQLEDTFGMVRGEYDLNDAWTAYLAGGVKHTREVGRYSGVTLVDNQGGTTVGGSFIPHDEDSTTVMAGLNGALQTGAISHKVSFGVSSIWAQKRNAFDFASTVPGDLYHPVTPPYPTFPGFVGGDIHDPGVTDKTTNQSLAISDTLGFMDDRLLVTVGLRRQSLLVQNYAYDGGSSSNYDGARESKYDKMITTPVYGVVFKPWEHVSFYANRIEGLAQGPNAPADFGGTPLTNANQSFAPARSKQIEAGVKVDMGTYGGSLGVYRIEQPADGYTDAATFTYVREGEQVNRGVELNIFGEPLDGLRLISGLTVMDTELKSTQNGANDGNDAIGVPRFQFNASVDWDVPGLEGVALNARMLRTGGQYADAANNLSLPTWNRFDLGARYGFKMDDKYITLRANVENVTNEEYWASAHAGYLTQGEPRLVKLSGTVDF
ncbi:TonB-dependent siderophore receptor [Pseudomonas sp. GD03944]|uniref:TonB-dependent receptor n=1 Tax=Pseudomonas sp. GD03944 TaxID=2975409 RepID=UPI002448D8C9|nr:TonB-dependent siderophore receptor [Pseudomonas sp. GD03944]MDH1264756.1 TonB-dependent siderophore receptor [Pseudomonas sp. GD03944]